MMERSNATGSQSAGGARPGRAQTVVNAGCGMRGTGRLPALFDQWRQLRVDIDPQVEPDILADIADLSVIPSEFTDAIWSAHCLEHLYQHQIGQALGEFRRILKDGGFLCLLVPDLQTVANYIVADQLDQVIYESPAGPVTAHDVLFGFGPAVARGNANMAHRCGFTPTTMIRYLREARFAEIVLRRRPSLELAAVALKTPSADPADRERLMADLAL
jgi:SAM-dependent methyltransferase